MSGLGFTLALLGLLFLSAAFSGSETGLYSLSRTRLEAEARAGRRSARILRALLRRDAALLVTLLVGNNLMLELATHLMQGQIARLSFLPEGTREVVLTLFLTPLVLVIGELLPKDLFRRRPHQCLGWLYPLLVVSRVLFLPLAWPLVALSGLLERLFGLRETELTRALRREEVVDMLQAGTREGALEAHAAALAENVLVLRETPVRAIQVPWAKVERVDLSEPRAVLQKRVRDARFTRLPAVRTHAGGVRVEGYLHQLELMAAEAGSAPEAHLRPLPIFPPDLGVDRALKRMRTSGQRMALVGTPEAPVGLVSLMDLLATISGDPAR